ncbi:MAG: hypothetical protein JNK11_01360 [Alphaproteobacteria bacterium]|nr:hypothetical protein [Alphaproteobacteria bacterium]
MRWQVLVLALAAMVLVACGHRSSSDVELAPGAPKPAAGAAAKNPATIVVTESDITDRRYVTIGDITASVSKNNMFAGEPDRSMVEAKLREKAAELGADAVVLARFGAPGITLFSWGSLEGKGRAVRFVQ